jgi:hypothetical protein
VQPIAAVGPDMDGRLLADLAYGRGDMRSVVQIDGAQPLPDVDPVEPDPGQAFHV